MSTIKYSERPVMLWECFSSKTFENLVEVQCIMDCLQDHNVKDFVSGFESADCEDQIGLFLPSSLSPSV